ncbi:1,2-phenylacetyl-CoA epoxidase subunit PaaE [Nocardioides ochotonae]|uniref:1,2-phenylacetyl-CoA epoxidase subunit PaaE n=1 Tax=Nocardioides ochotonae TaxID=2685869 RepID=UPI00140C6DE1|nr:1,2-phenylacetyl-CoA epoxidase subunit PaaE [Nocardioides ochotonae]
MGFHTLRVAAVEPLCADAAAITFEVPPELSAEYAFAAGQSVTLRREVDGVEQRRSYSLCAPVGAPPRIGVREIADGLFSSWLVREVRPGTPVEVLAPSGRFRAEPRPGERHLCVAAGSGITPVLSIAATVLEQPGTEVALLYGNRTSGSVMFVDELADLKDRYGPRVQLVHVLSREARDAELLTGRLDPDRLRRLLTELVPLDVLGVDHVWICGPFAMVRGAREVLAELGVPPERVHVELFHVDEDDVPPPPRRAPVAPTGATSEVRVVLDGRSTVVTAARDATVLDAVQSARADLPFACRGGVCGTCRARVVEGEVEMRRNHALEPDEVVAGFVLTCQAEPVSATVSVDFDA